MTKEEFLKKAMGASYSEREEGLLDMATAKKNLGAQFTEREFNKMVGRGEGKGLMELSDEENAYLRMMKENLGAQFTEKEGEAAARKTHTMPDGTVMQGATHMDMRNAMGAQYSERETDAFGLPIPELDLKALTQQFSSILGSISPMEQEKVLQQWQRSDDDGKVEFMKYIVNNPSMATGYGVQNETALPTQNLGL